MSDVNGSPICSNCLHSLQSLVRLLISTGISYRFLGEITIEDKDKHLREVSVKLTELSASLEWLATDLNKFINANEGSFVYRDPKQPVWRHLPSGLKNIIGIHRETKVHMVKLIQTLSMHHHFTAEKTVQDIFRSSKVNLIWSQLKKMLGSNNPSDQSTYSTSEDEKTPEKSETKHQKSDKTTDQPDAEPERISGILHSENSVEESMLPIKQRETLDRMTSRTNSEKLKDQDQVHEDDRNEKLEELRLSKEEANGKGSSTPAELSSVRSQTLTSDDDVNEAAAKRSDRLVENILNSPVGQPSEIPSTPELLRRVEGRDSSPRSPSYTPPSPPVLSSTALTAEIQQDENSKNGVDETMQGKPISLESEGFKLDPITINTSGLRRFERCKESTKVLIVMNEMTAEAKVASESISSFLRDRGVTVITASGNTIHSDRPADGWDTKRCDNQYDVDLMICFGGDGTLLQASGLFLSTVPLTLAFGLGFKNFLYPFQFEENTAREIVSKLLSGEEFTSLHRYRLSLQISHPGSGERRCVALNEVSIQRDGSRHLTQLNIYINHVYLCTIRGDGVLLSTGTGSTGYNLSAGGCLLYPSSDSMVITPLSCYPISIRPIVLPRGTTVSITLSEKSRRSSVNVYVDYRICYKLSGAGRADIRISDEPLEQVISVKGMSSKNLPVSTDDYWIHKIKDFII